MRFLAFTLTLCGFCFAQNDPQGGATQVSSGNCSINASNVRGRSGNLWRATRKAEKTVADLRAAYRDDQQLREASERGV